MNRGIAAFMGSPAPKNVAQDANAVGAVANKGMFIIKVIIKAIIPTSTANVIGPPAIAVKILTQTNPNITPDNMGGIFLDKASLLPPAKKNIAQPTKPGQVNMPNFAEAKVHIAARIPIDSDKGINCI
ncbi:MAG: hypothetical protein PWQ67_2627 [Clostridia bacterium]|nr:hypothetical protein [Clostridia bacterium]